MTTNTHIPTRTYSAESCHELGYDWTIEAPATLDADEIERLQEALTTRSDEPHQEELDVLLADAHACEEAGLTKIRELREVRFTAKLVHGDCWAQNFCEAD